MNNAKQCKGAADEGRGCIGEVRKGSTWTEIGSIGGEDLSKREERQLDVLKAEKKQLEERVEAHLQQHRHVDKVSKFLIDISVVWANESRK